MSDRPTFPGDVPAPREAPPVPLDRLERTLDPPPGVEDRVVGALRLEGLLGSAGRRAGLRFAPGWRAAAVAAGLALFAGGYAAGQAAGSRVAVDVLTSLQAADPAERAAALQRTGSAYVRAVTSLEGSDPAAAGHEVAVATLRAAAAELARMSPDDARLARVLAILNGSDADPAEGAMRTLLWF
jgi:hypothetical protein